MRDSLRYLSLARSCNRNDRVEIEITHIHVLEVLLLHAFTVLMRVLSEHKWLLMRVVAGRALRVDWSSNHWLMYSLFLLDFLFSLVRLRVFYFIVLFYLVRIAGILYRSFLFLSRSASLSLGLVLDDLNHIRADHGHLNLIRLFLFLIRLHLSILLKREGVYFGDRFLLLEDRPTTISSSLVVNKVRGGSSAQHRRLVEGADVVPC